MRTDIITPIMLTDAVVKYKVDYLTLLELGKHNLIVITTISDIVFADENSIIKYFKFEEKLKNQEEYFTKLINEKKEEFGYTLIAYDDYLFSMRSLEKTIKIFPVIIDELSQLIKDERTRDIFINIALGKDISSIARKYSLTYDKTCSIYEHAIDQVIRRGSLFKKYSKRIIELAKQNRILNLLVENLKEHITRLQEAKGIYIEIDDLKNVPDHALYLLSLSIKKDLGLDLRCINTLNNAGFNTIEDLLRYVCNHNGKLDSLLEIPNFGSVYLGKLRKVLYNKSIVDENGYSFLLDFLI